MSLRGRVVIGKEVVLVVETTSLIIGQFTPHMYVLQVPLTDILFLNGSPLTFASNLLTASSIAALTTLSHTVVSLLLDAIDAILRGLLFTLVTGPLHFLLTGSLHTLLNGPLDVFVTGPLHALLTGPLHFLLTGLLHALLTGPLHALLTGPLHALLTGPLHALLTDPLHALLTDPLHALLTGPLHALLTGPLHALLTGPLHALLTGGLHALLTDQSSWTAHSSYKLRLTFVGLLTFSDWWEYISCVKCDLKTIYGTCNLTGTTLVLQLVRVDCFWFVFARFHHLERYARVGIGVLTLRESLLPIYMWLSLVKLKV